MDIPFGPYGDQTLPEVTKVRVDLISVNDRVPGTPAAPVGMPVRRRGKESMGSHWQPTAQRTVQTHQVSGC